MADNDLTQLVDAINRLTLAIETNMGKPIEFKPHKPKRLNSTEMIREKIKRNLSRGEKTIGVLHNQLRSHEKDELNEHLSEMLVEGLLSARSTTHPINGRQTVWYGVAAVLNRPQGPEGDE